MASPMPSASSDADHHRGAQQGHLWLQRNRLEDEAILQEDGSATAHLFEPGGQQPERGDRREFRGRP